jgi:hypothetical protein
MLTGDGVKNMRVNTVTQPLAVIMTHHMHVH